jgi:hypothetical protein
VRSLCSISRLGTHRTWQRGQQQSASSASAADIGEHAAMARAMITFAFMCRRSPLKWKTIRSSSRAVSRSHGRQTVGERGRRW